MGAQEGREEKREDHGHVQGEAELPLRQRGSHQQADQHGAICLLRLSLHVCLLCPSRHCPPWLLQEVQGGLHRGEGPRHEADRLPDHEGRQGFFREIAKPSMDEWGTALEAVEATLELEKTVNESL